VDITGKNFALRLIGESLLRSKITISICLPNGHVLDRLFLTKSETQDIINHIQSGTETDVNKGDVHLSLSVSGQVVNLSFNAYTIERKDTFSLEELSTALQTLFNGLP